MMMKKRNVPNGRKVIKDNAMVKFDLLRIEEVEVPTGIFEEMNQKERQQLKRHIDLHQIDAGYMYHEGIIHSFTQVPMLSYEEFLLNYSEIFIPTDSENETERICNKSPKNIYGLYVMGYEDAPRHAKFVG